MNDIKYKGHSIQIEYDEFSESPREWENAGNLVCFHGRYELGDNLYLSSDDFNNWEELKDFLIKEKGAIPELTFPVYLYDHSGLRIKIGSFAGHLPQGHAYFDSGQIGFIYTTHEDIKRIWGKIDKETLEYAEKSLHGEIETYDQYLSGDVWGYNIKKDNDEIVDSCWGFYGYDVAVDEAKSIIDSIANAK